jgi:hypothetical protein
MTEQPSDQNAPIEPDRAGDETPADGRGVEMTTGEPNTFEPEEEPDADTEG